MRKMSTIDLEKISWNQEDYWKRLSIFDSDFLEIGLDHMAFDVSKWDEFIKKWDLKIRIIDDDCSAYNDNYSIVMSGLDGFIEDIENKHVPGYYLALTFSKNVNMKTLIEYIGDFHKILDHADDLEIVKGLNSSYISHPKEIKMKMIEYL